MTSENDGRVSWISSLHRNDREASMPPTPNSTEGRCPLFDKVPWAAERRRIEYPQVQWVL